MLQAEQHGTGHAVAQAMPQVPDDHLVLVLYGDVPLVQTETLARLVAEAGEGAISILSVMLPDPTGYGRVVRDGAGNVVRIVEHKDANTKERAIHECNTGVMCAPAGRLRAWLAALRNDNAQGEYYLTDVIVAAVQERPQGAGRGRAHRDRSARRERQAAARRARGGLPPAARRRADAGGRHHRGPGAIRCARRRSASAATCYIDVNVVFEGTVKLGDRVRIGPNVVIRDSEIGDDTEIHRQLRDRSCHRGSALPRRSLRAAASRGDCFARTCTSATSSR